MHQKELFDFVLFLFSKFIDVFDCSQKEEITSVILSVINELSYDSKRDSLLFLVHLNDCSTFFSIELFQHLINFLENDSSIDQFLVAISKMFANPLHNENSKIQMLEIIAQNESLFEDLVLSANPLISTLSQLILSSIQISD